MGLCSFLWNFKNVLRARARLSVNMMEWATGVMTLAARVLCLFTNDGMLSLWDGFWCVLIPMCWYEEAFWQYLGASCLTCTLALNSLYIYCGIVSTTCKAFFLLFFISFVCQQCYQRLLCLVPPAFNGILIVCWVVEKVKKFWHQLNVAYLKQYL